MVDELLELSEDGMTIKDENGVPQHSFAALIAAVCDTPAARRVGGFTAPNGIYPCTTCWCSRKELHEFNKLFPRRSRAEQKEAAKAYHKLKNENQRKNFLTRKHEPGKPGGYRPSTLLRPPIREPEIMVTVNLMHILFLDWQFKLWVDMHHLEEGSSELDELQKMVKSTCRPRHCGCPPGRLGTSAAGTLHADPLRSMMSIDLPLAIPVIWGKVDIQSMEQQTCDEWSRRKAAEEKKKAKAKKGDKVTRAAEKARQKAEEAAEAAAKAAAAAAGATNPKKRRRQNRAGKSTASTSKQQDDKSSDDESGTAEARALADAENPLERDAQERGFFYGRSMMTSHRHCHKAPMRLDCQ
ncbi:hypothetical protein FRC09_005220 [Ceratobasidium sp. 395]|nr:hypothetical protein FRC09_005220 [Ceratobasidium sp. 395]